MNTWTKQDEAELQEHLHDVELLRKRKAKAMSPMETFVGQRIGYGREIYDMAESIVQNADQLSELLVKYYLVERRKLVRRCRAGGQAAGFKDRRKKDRRKQ